MVKKLLPYQILVFITHGETLKLHTITINLKYLHTHAMMNLNCLMYGILCQIFKIILNILKKKKKKHGQNTNKSAVQTYVNEIENMITFKIKDGYSLELLRNTKNEITGDKNGENIPH